MPSGGSDEWVYTLKVQLLVKQKLSWYRNVPRKPSIHLGLNPEASVGGFLMLLSEAIEEYLKWKAHMRKKATARNYSFALRQFGVFVRNKELEEIKVKDVTEWFDLMQTLGWSHNSFIPMTMALRGMFQYYRAQGYSVLNELLLAIPHKEYQTPRIVTPAAFQKLLGTITDDVADVRDRAIMYILWSTGMRNGELCSLNLSDINPDWRGATIRTEKSQGRKPFRPVFWPDETARYVKEWVVMRNEFTKDFRFLDPDALFIGIGGPRAGKRTTIAGVMVMLANRSHAAGIPVVNAHSFRHRIGHTLAERGINNSSISGILGHSSLSSSYRYTDLSAPELEKVYRQTFG